MADNQPIIISLLFVAVHSAVFNGHVSDRARHYTMDTREPYFTVYGSLMDNVHLAARLQVYLTGAGEGGGGGVAHPR